MWPNHAFMQSKKNNRSIKLSITEFQSFASFVPSSCDGRDSIHPTKTKLQTRNNEYLVLYTWIGFVWFMIFAMEQLSFLCILGFQLYFLFWCDLFPIYVKLFICWKICNILTCFILSYHSKIWLRYDIIFGIWHIWKIKIWNIVRSKLSSL